MKPDAFSGWSTSPRAARLAGDWPAFRCFDTLDQAAAFLAPLVANAEKQRRYRQRQREEAVVIRGLALPGEVVSALIDWGQLDQKGACDPKQIGGEAVAVLIKWSREWRTSFSVTK